MNLQGIKEAVKKANNSTSTPEALKKLKLATALGNQFKGTPIAYNMRDMEVGMYKLNKVDSFEKEVIVDTTTIKHNGILTTLKVTKCFTSDITEYLVEVEF